MPKCVTCGCKAGKHHIVFKGSKTIIVYLPINEVDLCKKCHEEVHKNRDMDRKYKSILQKKLESMFSQEYYDVNDIKNILKINRYQLKVLLKNVNPQGGGCSSGEVIKYLMGGRVY